MKRQVKICIAGGHLSPAYAVAAYLKKKYNNCSIVFIGREHTFTSKQYATHSVEKDVMAHVSDYVYIVPIERLSISPHKVLVLLRSFFYTYQYLSKTNPSVVVIFGGYVGFVVGLAAWLNNIPIVIHEQTHTLGTTNRLLGHIAKKICVSYVNMVSRRCIYTGFPLREEILSPPIQPSVEIQKTKPILYITGGTTGAVFLNDLCFSVIDKLLYEYTIVHQTGAVSYDKATIVQENLPISIKNSYIVVPYLESKDASWMINNATAIISRSGANTVYELAVVKTPSILLPLPRNLEQMENAQWLGTYAPTVVIKQKEARPEDILTALRKLLIHHGTTFATVPTDGTERLCKEIVSTI